MRFIKVVGNQASLVLRIWISKWTINCTLVDTSPQINLVMAKTLVRVSTWAKIIKTITFRVTSVQRETWPRKLSTKMEILSDSAASSSRTRAVRTEIPRSTLVPLEEVFRGTNLSIREIITAEFWATVLKMLGMALKVMVETIGCKCKGKRSPLKISRTLRKYFEIEYALQNHQISFIISEN